MKKEFTATVFLIENQKVLLIYHPKLQKWLPPGGHIEPNETPAEAARREVLEETGFEIEFYLQENIFISHPNAKSIERPYYCLLENIPHYGNTPAHQHVDFIYVGKPLHRIEQTEQAPKEASSSHLPYRWFSWKELTELEPGTEIFQDTLEVISHLYDSNSRSLFENKFD